MKQVYFAGMAETLDAPADTDRFAESMNENIERVHYSSLMIAIHRFFSKMFSFHFFRLT